MEPLLITLLVAVGIWPLWSAAGNPGLGAWRLLLVGVGGLVTAASYWIAASSPTQVAEVFVDRPVAGGGDGFVSSPTCGRCHPREDASWQASHHRRMTQAATPENVIPEFESMEFGHAVDRLRLELRGGRYFAAIAQDEPGGGVVWIEREVVQTTGSHNFQAFWFPSGRGRELTLFPYCYRIDEARWMPVDAAFLMPPNTLQPLGGARWNTNCVNCHTTQGQPRVHEANKVDTHVAELGIGCESCHGPGLEHVDANHDPFRRYALHLSGDADPTIDNPERMTPERQAEVCGQCHGVTIARTELQETWAREGFTYRPGDELRATRLLVEPDAAAEPELRRTLERQPDFFDTVFWPDGQVRIGGRDYHGLIASPCYVDGEGDRKMTCLSCHTMHPESDDPRALAEWADDQLKPGMRGDLGCTQCHDGYRDEEALRAHTRHEDSGVGCYDCHMPYTTFGLLKSIRSHTVTSPSVQETVEHGRPNACNLCHLDQTLGWTAAELEEGWGIGAPELGPDEREIAAVALWALKGDAGERALVAAALAYQPGRVASGVEWRAPFVAELLRDPYHAVRFVAGRALRTEEGGAGIGYDFLAPEAKRQEAVARYEEWWSQRWSSRRERDLARVLIDGGGKLRGEVFRRLLSQRDNRPMYLGE